MTATKEEIMKKFSWHKNKDAESEALSRTMLQYVGQSKLADDHNSGLKESLNMQAKAIFEDIEKSFKEYGTPRSLNCIHWVELKKKWTE